MENNNQPIARKNMRRVAAALCVASLAVSGVVAAIPASGTPSGGVPNSTLQRLVDEAEIEALTKCYAQATDAVAAGNSQLADSLYEKCFLHNAIIDVYNPGDPEGSPSLVDNAGDWVHIVEDAFDSGGYGRTQHLISNIQIKFINSNTAKMSTYLHATHVIEPESAVDIANGTYEDTVVRTSQGWKISRRTLRLITYYRVESP
ncbi:nuclear transport factor 2 family protein [Chondromyces apiculatus]|uniref:SnoaL-like domain-containing protein n=1 Tax=Chondromyces apiculatus DSM 436 TaxID=1192034 RepID=A0A017TC92_9BACT|nr:nuclear transport factor 2 family protein [Chondromyces apiculatus]EYF06903.1 Hypothetical protein CAP_1161 [Chondromyces apiculatus DSM 436]